MGNSLMKYIEWVELESFFSGYLLVYAIIYLVASNRFVSNFVKIKVLPNLPLAYALVGTLYCGLQFKNGYSDYLMAGIQFPYLKTWGLLSILFWIPFLHKKAIVSLLHSLVFFFLLMKSFYLQLSIPSGGSELAGNNIKIYTASIILNLIAVVFVTIISLLIARFKRQKQSTRI